jgi:hypothetical protein
VRSRADAASHQCRSIAHVAASSDSQPPATSSRRCCWPAAVQIPCIEDADLTIAAEMLAGPVDDGQEDKAEAGQASEMIP